MNNEHKNNNLEQLVDALGIQDQNRINAIIQNVDFNIFKAYNFAPDLLLLIRSYIVREDFKNEIGSITAIEDGILFAFNNIFEDALEQNIGNTTKPIHEMPYIQVIPLKFRQELLFHKHTHKKHITIIISKTYLQSFLKDDLGNFDYLFKDEGFLIEEFMSDDMLKTAIDIVKADVPTALKNYYFKWMALGLLFHLFRSLEKRGKLTHQSLRADEIATVYKVRDKLISSLEKPVSMVELKQFAGMNEIKLRSIFKQIFGMGIYQYFQCIRMKEAARLLKEEKLSVSEAGYQMGFSNLSHFSREFEKYMGMKPKKYSVIR